MRTIVGPTIGLLIALLLPASVSASTRLLLFDDIGFAEATFAWDKRSQDGVAVSAVVDLGVCMDEQCHGTYSTAALADFERSGRSVYYVGAGAGGTRVACGETGGFLSSSRFEESCRILVEPVIECVAWVAPDDCGRAVTRYRVYLVIDD